MGLNLLEVSLFALCLLLGLLVLRWSIVNRRIKNLTGEEGSPRYEEGKHEEEKLQLLEVMELEREMSKALGQKLGQAGIILKMAGISARLTYAQITAETGVKIDLPLVLWQVKSERLIALSLVTACRFLLSSDCGFARSKYASLCASELADLLAMRAKENPLQAMMVAINMRLECSLNEYVEDVLR